MASGDDGSDVDLDCEIHGPSEFDFSIANAVEKNMTGFRRMAETEGGYDFEFEIPEMVKTEGFNEKQLKAPLLSDERTLKKTKVMQYDKNFDEVVDTIVGDFSDLELLMTCVNDGDDRLKKLMLKSGTGPSVKINQLVKVHYIMSAEFMDDIIESTHKKNHHSRFRLGTGEVLPILDVGVQTMRVGEVSKFLSTSELGYGKQGVPLENGEVIPPDSRLLIQVELVDAQDSTNFNSIHELSDAEKGEIGFDKMLKFGEDKKAEGNEYFKEGIYDKALISYKSAFGCLKHMTPIGSEEAQKNLQLRGILLKNLSMTSFKLEEFKSGFKYGKAAADLKVPKDLKAKANYWCAKCSFEIGKFEEGLAYAKTARDLSSDNDVKELYDKYQKKKQESQAKEKETCIRMMKAVTIKDTKTSNAAT